MKNSMFILVLLLCAITYGQSETFPICVEDAFKTKFPGAKNIYRYPQEDKCRIEFDLLADSYIVMYTKTGEWLETGKIISDMEIPAAVVSSFKKQYTDCQISYAEMVVNNKGASFYRVNSMKNFTEFVIDITKEGRIIDSKEIQPPPTDTTSVSGL